MYCMQCTVLLCKVLLCIVCNILLCQVLLCIVCNVLLCQVLLYIVCNVLCVRYCCALFLLYAIFCCVKYCFNISVLCATFLVHLYFVHYNTLFCQVQLCIVHSIRLCHGNDFIEIFINDQPNRGGMLPSNRVSPAPSTETGAAG